MARKFGVDAAPVTFSVKRIPNDRTGELHSPQSTGFVAQCFMRDGAKLCYRNVCAYGVETAVDIQIVGREMHPFTRFIPFVDGPAMVLSGSLRVADRECMQPHSGYSERTADDYTNTWEIGADLNMLITYGMCGDLLGKAFDFNVELTAGIRVSSNAFLICVYTITLLPRFTDIPRETR